MKQLLLKINRGVILSIAVILAIVVYYIVIQIMTIPVKKSTVQLVTGITQVVNEAVIVPDEYKKDGVTEAQLQPYKDKIIDKLQPYFASKNDAKAFFDDFVWSDITPQTIEPTGIYKKDVYVLKSVNNVKITGKTATADLEINNTQTIEEIKVSVDANGKTTRTPSGNTSTYDTPMQLSIKLANVNGKWLVSEFLTGGTFNQQIPVNIQEGGY